MSGRHIPGIVTGIVKSDPDELGQVEVEFPWLGTDHERPRVPVAMPLTGGSRGMYFMPEQDDEVLVAFDHGNFAHPYIVGFVWNGVDKPPETDRQNRVIHTPGGHELRFEDGNHKVVLSSSGGHKIELDDNAHTIKLTASGGGNEIVIDAGGTVTVRAASSVTVAAPQIALTEGAAHPLVFGDALIQLLNSMADAFDTHLHPGQLAAGVLPVTPMKPAAPFPRATPALNSTQVKTG